MIEYVFRGRKTAQAAALLLELPANPLSKGELVKLLYLADRRAIVERGHSITGDRAVSMPHGPVLSRVLNALDGKNVEPEFGAAWNEYIAPAGARGVTLGRALGACSELSPFERRILHETHNEFGSMGWEQLKDYGHGLAEWTNPGGSMVPIDITVILRAAGWAECDIDAVANEVDAVRSMHFGLESVR
jgi:uncharacterized phage-associated protein